MLNLQAIQQKYAMDSKPKGLIRNQIDDLGRGGMRLRIGIVVLVEFVLGTETDEW